MLFSFQSKSKLKKTRGPYISQALNLASQQQKERSSGYLKHILDSGTIFHSWLVILVNSYRAFMTDFTGMQNTWQRRG